MSCAPDTCIVYLRFYKIIFCCRRFTCTGGGDNNKSAPVVAAEKREEHTLCYWRTSPGEGNNLIIIIILSSAHCCTWGIYRYNCCGCFRARSRAAPVVHRLIGIVTAASAIGFSVEPERALDESLHRCTMLLVCGFLLLT